MILNVFGLEISCTTRKAAEEITISQTWIESGLCSTVPQNCLITSFKSTICLALEISFTIFWVWNVKTKIAFPIFTQLIVHQLCQGNSFHTGFFIAVSFSFSLAFLSAVLSFNFKSSCLLSITTV